MKLKPFFTYYGGKYRIAKYYPPPEYLKIIEPFAGSAGYSLNYCEKEIYLFDVDKKICDLWKYLINVTEKEIMDLPEQIEDLRISNLSYEQKLLIGFWLNKGSTGPRNKPSSWMRQGLCPNSWWGKAIKVRISSQLKYIRHWKISNISYNEIENMEGTWFIDPPYFGLSGAKYKFHKIDYNQLALWCKERHGQKIVCEMFGATYLPFVDFKISKSCPGSRGKGKVHEVIWTEKVQ